ncbi:MAG: hypothetical protein JWQ69_3512 [Pseudomonas sp.]|nr:hypothetical protein [Pseudomonas sp.]
MSEFLRAPTKVWVFGQTIHTGLPQGHTLRAYDRHPHPIDANSDRTGRHVLDLCRLLLPTGSDADHRYRRA